MAWYRVGIVAQLSAEIGWTRTSASPASGTETLDFYDTTYYGGYVQLYNGSVILPEVDVSATNDGGAITAPDKGGYDFDGWYTYSGSRTWGGGGYKLDDATIRISSNKSIDYPTIFSQAGTLNAGGGQTIYMIYAKWRPKTVVVVFDVNGGQLPSGSNYFIRVTYNSPYGALPTPTRDGYTFAGWYTAATGGTQVTDRTIVTNPDDHILYAHWTAAPVPHTLYFDAMGGVCSEVSRQINSGAPYGALPTPTWAYHTFVGWFTDPYSGTQVDANTIMADDDVIVYAHWTDATIAVVFDGNGGNPTTQTVSYAAGAPYGSLASATRDGFILEGWYTAATGGTRVQPEDIATAQTLYAHWTPAGGSASGVIWHNVVDFIMAAS